MLVVTTVMNERLVGYKEFFEQLTIETSNLKKVIRSGI